MLESGFFVHEFVPLLLAGLASVAVLSFPPQAWLLFSQISYLDPKYHCGSGDWF